MPADEMSTEVLHGLVEEAREGDREAYRQVVVAVLPSVRMAIAAHAPHPQQMEETVTAVMVAAWEQLDNFRGGDFLEWIRGVARNHQRAEFGSRLREPPVGMDELDVLVTERQLESLGDVEIAETREVGLAFLRGCLERLPAELRQPLEAHHFEGRTLAELATEAEGAAPAETLFDARAKLASTIREMTGDAW